MSNNIKNLVKELVYDYPELANSIYFALDEELVKTKKPWGELTEVVHKWVNVSGKQQNS